MYDLSNLKFVECVSRSEAIDDENEFIDTNLWRGVNILDLNNTMWLSSTS